MPEVHIPADFRATVTTPPARVDNTTVPLIQAYVQQLKLAEFDGDRIVHLHQVEQIDSSAVVALLQLLQRAKNHGREFVMCEPPPIVRSYLELYGAADMVESRVLSSNSDGTYVSEVLHFVPPFVPNPAGRIDVYIDGKARSYEFGEKNAREIAPVDLSTHPAKARARAKQMALKEGRELTAQGFVHVRKHNCGCGATHRTFGKLFELHDWFRKKGFDFQQLELWASDVPAGMVAERMSFRDRLHYDQFQTLLKIDSGWEKIGAPMEHIEEEYYYAY